MTLNELLDLFLKDRKYLKNMSERTMPWRSDGTSVAVNDPMGQ